MIMHNHGVLTVGKTAREAFILMKHLLEAAEIQLAMEATGGELIEIPAEICRKTVAQYEKHDSGRGSADWPAYCACSIASIRAIGTDDARPPAGPCRRRHILPPRIPAAPMGAHARMEPPGPRGKSQDLSCTGGTC